MFTSTILCKPLKIPARAFNCNPKAAIKSLVGNSTVVMHYEVSNYIDNNMMLTVNVYYKALDTSKVYYIKPQELKSRRVSNVLTPTYISDLVTIQLRAPYNEREIVPLDITVMDKPIEVLNDFIITNYYARPLKSPFKTFTTSTILPRDYRQALYFTEANLKMTSIELNQLENKEPYTIPTLKSTIDELNKGKRFTANDLEAICLKFLSIVDLKSPILKGIQNLQYIPSLPTSNTLPSSTKFGYITHYNNNLIEYYEFKYGSADNLIEYIKKYKFGILIAPNTRPYADLVIYIPSLSFVIESNQLDTFTKLMINDIITAHNFSIIS